MTARAPSLTTKPLKTILALAAVALAAFGLTLNRWVPDSMRQTIDRLRGVPAATATPLLPVSMNAASDSYGATTWYFAQGLAQSDPTYHTWLLLANPSSGEVTAIIHYYGAAGEIGNASVAVPAHGRTAVHANDNVSGSFATSVSASGPIVAEQSVFFANDGYTVQGVATPSTIWYLPEGTTNPGYDTKLYIYNPGSSATTATLTFYNEAGQSQTVSKNVPALSQLPVTLTSECTLSGGVGTVVSAAMPVVVQRVTFFAGADSGKGGHASTGVSLLSGSWYFPLGWSGTLYDTWLMLLNPGGSPVTVQARFQAGTTTKTATYTLAPHSRTTVWVDHPNVDMAPATNFGMVLSGDGAFAAESAVYDSTYKTGDTTMGAPGAANTWYFAEGSTATPYTMRLALYNPGATGALVNAAFLPTPSGATAPSWALLPGEMKLIDLNQSVSGANLGFALYSDVPVVATRLLSMTPYGMLAGSGLPAAAVATHPVAFIPNVSSPRQATATPTATALPGVTATPIRRAGIITYVLSQPITGTANCGTTGLKGRITDAAGNPLSGVRVRVWADGWGGGLSNPTDSSGNWDYVLGTGTRAGTWYAAVSQDDGTLLSPAVLMPTSSDCANGQQWIQADWKVREGELPAYYLAWSRRLSCAENNQNHHLFIDITDADGNGLAGITVRVTWDGGQQDILTGNKLDVGPGRVEFPMYKGTYNVRVYTGSSDTAANLTVNLDDEGVCSNHGNTLYHFSYHVVLRRY
ncbi:MAG: hypothetical protein ACYC5O_04885 [Anaerolineae bacterium]